LYSNGFELFPPAQGEIVDRRTADRGLRKTFRKFLRNQAAAA